MTIVDSLHNEHRSIAKLLDILEHQIDVMAQAGAPDYELIQGIADYFCDYPDRCHHPKENEIFARLREKFPEEAEAIGNIGQEHDVTAGRVREFRQLIREILQEGIVARTAAVGAARNFIEAERRHMEMEEARFFSVAEKKLAPEDWAQVEENLTKERDPLSQGKADQDYKDLRERLLAWARDCQA